MKRKIFTSSFVLLLMAAGIVRGEVKDSTFYGFTVSRTIILDAAPQSVFDHFVSDIGDWWDPEHTYSGDAANLFIQPKPSGCFCEVLPTGGFVTHMDILYADPGKILRMSGGLGPLQSLPVQGVLTMTLKAQGNTTQAEFIYTVGGYSAGGLQKFAPLVDMVLTQQWERFRKYVSSLPEPVGK